MKMTAMHHPNYTPEKRAHALAWIRGTGLLDRDDLDVSARLTAVIGLLICDDSGFISADDLTTALVDPWLREVAWQLLIEARSDDTGPEQR